MGLAGALPQEMAIRVVGGQKQALAEQQGAKQAVGAVLRGPRLVLGVVFGLLGLPEGLL